MRVPKTSCEKVSRLSQVTLTSAELNPSEIEKRKAGSQEKYTL